MEEKYGFIYIWRDRKHKRYYIGSHWGTEDDGYICSSTTMRNARRDRPSDFKRWIIKRIHTNRIDLLNEEQRWLDMIPREEFGKKYYNKNARTKGYWWCNENTKKEIGQKISNSSKGKKLSDETKQKLIGKKRSKETCKKMSESHIGVKLSEEHRKRKNEGLRQYYQNGGISWNKGKKSSDKHRRNQSEALKNHTVSEETRKKIGKANQGRKFSETHRKKLSESHKHQIKGIFQKGHLYHKRKSIQFCQIK